MIHFYVTEDSVIGNNRKTCLFIFYINLNLSFAIVEGMYNLHPPQVNMLNLANLALCLSAFFMPLSSHEISAVQESRTNKYERILLTQLRDKNSSTKEFREAANRLTEILVHRVVECLPTCQVEIDTPVANCLGEKICSKIEFVFVMRSGDALLDIFCKHFPEANINKILIQRDEETAEPHFKYMKLSPTINLADVVVITEPMIATGGTLSCVINLLKEKGVQERNIVIAAVLAAPEGLTILRTAFPTVKIITIVIDEKLNEKKYITPGLGDFGDRYFGT